MGDLKVLTLNSWGILYLAKDVEARMLAIANELAKGHYDLVNLQEVWSLRHFEIISKKVELVLPYSHYFHSGVIGSGCATFSRYPIVDSFSMKYSHNGYFWDVLHGDWFAGKAVGCVVIKHPKKKIFSFNTHLHADYGGGETKNCFDECRTLQIYQLSQLVRRTTRPGDAVILCGDFNHQPDEVGMKALLELSKLNDSYKLALSKPEGCYTLNKEFNRYTDKNDLVSRLDYILVSDIFECSTCNLALQKIPNTDLHFSDHEGYTATLEFKDGEDCKGSEYQDTVSSYNLLKQLYAIISRGERSSNEIHWQKISFLVVLFVLLILMPIFSLDTFHVFFPDITSWQGKGIFILQIVSFVFCVTYFWVNTVIRQSEVKAFKNVCSEIQIKLRAMETVNDKKVN